MKGESGMAKRSVAPKPTEAPTLRDIIDELEKVGAQLDAIAEVLDHERILGRLLRREAKRVFDAIQDLYDLRDAARLRGKAVA
jgi:hypothetical protein